jgi:hypothetical protein
MKHLLLNVGTSNKRTLTLTTATTTKRTKDVYYGREKMILSGHNLSMAFETSLYPYAWSLLITLTKKPPTKAGVCNMPAAAQTIRLEDHLRHRW